MKNFVSSAVCRAAAVAAVLSVISAGPAAAHPRMKASASDHLLVQRAVAPSDDMVVVPTNRWKPDRCLWIVDKKTLGREKPRIVFPFADLFNAVCHIIVGVSDTHVAYAHLTPLTSFMRTDTAEVEKIIHNLTALAPEGGRWSFRVYYFADGNREARFRDVIQQALGGYSVRFTAIFPDRYSGGDINLVLSHDGSISYTQDEDSLMVYDDHAHIGNFNSIPINAIE